MKTPKGKLIPIGGNEAKKQNTGEDKEQKIDFRHGIIEEVILEMKGKNPRIVVLPLASQQQEEFEQMIQREEVSVMQFVTSWEMKGRRDTLLEQLQEKFGSVTETTIQQVRAIASIEELSQLLRQLIHANSIEEIGLDGKKE